MNERIKKLRKELTLTQQAFADEIGINRSTLSLLETGKQLPTLEILNKICDFSKTIIDEFFIENEKDGLIYLMGNMDESDRKKNWDYD